MPRSLPVTLIGGFLGAGKTSLLHHLVTEQPGGHLAMLVERTGELNLDAKALRGLCGAMRRSYDTVGEFLDGAELVDAVREIAQTARHERLLVEVSGLTLAPRWLRTLKEASVPVQVENVVVVVDLLEFHHTFVVPSARAADASLREFQRAQIEGATLVVLNKCDLADDPQRQAATRLLRTMNPKARIIETGYGEVPPAEIFRAAPIDFPNLAMEAPQAAPSFESVVYRAYRPFHPQRFWDWFNAPHDGLFRVKGIVWLATRNLLVGGVSRTGLQNSCGAAGIWWAALPREEWPEDPAVLMQMQANWREPYGDRRQELLLLGEQGPTSDAARKLNLCLLTNEEAALPDWREWPDPFPAWDLDEEA